MPEIAAFMNPYENEPNKSQSIPKLNSWDDLQIVWVALFSPINTMDTMDSNSKAPIRIAIPYVDHAGVSFAWRLAHEEIDTKTEHQSAYRSFQSYSKETMFSGQNYFRKG